MKISDLKIGNYVVVNDLGAGKYSSGMRVIGRVVEIDDKGNYAIIESLPKHRYEITDFNDFELWTKEIEDKTESMGLNNQSNDVQQRKRGELNISVGMKTVPSDTSDTVNHPSHYNYGDIEVIDFIEQVTQHYNPNKWLEKAIEENKENSKSVLEAGLGVSKPTTDHKQSNDVQQRKRKEENTALFKIKDLKVGYKVKMLDDDMTGEISEIADNGKYAEIKIDNGVYRGINDNCDFTITEWNSVPEYAEDTVNSPSHYNYGDIEVIDYCDQVCKQYTPELAPYVFNAIKYLSRANHKNGREDIDKAKYYVQRLFDKWNQ